MNSHLSKKDSYKPNYFSTFWRMIVYREDHLRFRKDFTIPYINNAVERQNRVVKAKKKISGYFVSIAGFASYAKVMIHLQTSEKNTST